MSKIIEHSANGIKWLLVEVPEYATGFLVVKNSLRWKTSPNKYWWDQLILPSEGLEIVGKADSLTEGQWKEVMSTVAGWKESIYYNHTAKGMDYRDIVDAAFDTAKESGLSFLAKHGLNESTTLILKSTQLL